MKYARVAEARFIARPNRFMARAALDGEEITCHVKNTGRCRELLIPGARVVLAWSGAPERKTQWDLVAVWKGETLVNIDSQAPNKVFAEWARATGFPQGLVLLKPESKWGASRFDFYYEAGEERGYIEVKGVTLESGGTARFPDAPTLRGARHLRELAECRRQGLGAYLAFVVQMEGMKRVAPNRAMDPGFADALEAARRAGVKVIALGCRVGVDALEITENIPVDLRI